MGVKEILQSLSLLQNDGMLESIFTGKLVFTSHCYNSKLGVILG